MRPPPSPTPSSTPLTPHAKTRNEVAFAPDPKTHVSLYASPEQLHQNHHNWGLTEIQQKATLNTPLDPLKTLGGTFGGAQNRRTDFTKRCKVMQDMYHKLTTLNDPAENTVWAKAKSNTYSDCTDKTFNPS